MESVVCSACGARMREGRGECFRCGNDLKPTAAASQSAVASRKTLYIAGVSLVGACIALALGLPAAFQSPSAAEATAPGLFDAAAPAPVVAPEAAAPQAQPEVQESVHPVTASAAPMALLKSAGPLFDAGDYAGALEQYEALLRTAPDNVDALNNAGLALTRLNRAPEAIVHLRRAAELAPRRPDVRFNLARALEAADDAAGAGAEYRALVELNPTDYATRFNLGRALHAQGDDAGAAKEYLEAIKLQPGEARFHLALGISLERLQKNAEAADAYARYVELAPGASDLTAVKARMVRLQARPS